METQDSRRFFVALSSMAEFLGDELAESRQRLYWDLMAPLASIEEWEYACHQALLRQEFHKVPLPAVMLDFVREYRKIRKEERGRVRHHELTAEQIPLEELKAFTDSMWPDDRLKDPIPPYETEETP